MRDEGRNDATSTRDVARDRPRVARIVAAADPSSSSRVMSDRDALRDEFRRWSAAQLDSFLSARGVELARDASLDAKIERACDEELFGDVEREGDAREALEEEEVDPLDAFMADLETTTTQPKPTGTRDDDDDDDDAFERSMLVMSARGKPVPGRRGAARERKDDEDEDDDEAAAAATAASLANDANERGPRGARDELPIVDHASVSYEPFTRATYAAPRELAEMSAEDVAAARRALDVRVDGCDFAPTTRFGQGGALDVDALRALKRLGFETPTGVQAQCLPIITSGRDVLACAKTGSGKTLAFLLPAFAQLSRRPRAGKRDGPRALVLAPTRELATQIANETHRFIKAGVPIRCSAVFGGVSKTEQFKKLRAGVDLLVATPGRLIDVLCMKNSIHLRDVTYLALDEADKMLDMGFERAVRSLCRTVRPDRQCVLFSATMPPAVRRLVGDVLARDHVTVFVGNAGGSNEDVTQIVRVFDDDASRWTWTFEHLAAFVNDGQALVFVNHKATVDELVRECARRGIKAVGLHGDLDQGERQDAMRAFKSERAHVLVATDVAARGLDVDSIKTVINFHASRDISTHVHRIGRTGRAGATDGRAYTLLTARDSAKTAQCLEKNLRDAGQDAPLDLKALARGAYCKRARAEEDGDFGASASGRGGKIMGGRGLGFTGAPAHARARFGGGRGPPRSAPNENFSAVPPPSAARAAPPPPPPALANAMVAQARARAEAIAKQFAPPPPPTTTAASASAPTNDPAAAAAAAARAIAARLAANAPK